MNTTADPGAALRRTDEAWSTAASEGKDVERVVAFWSDDATVMPAGGPPRVGKAAIRQFVADSFATPGFRIGWRTQEVEVSRDGTLGYTTGDSSMTAPGPDGQLVTLAGRGVAIWRKDASDEWKCVYDTWNFGP